MVDAAYWMKGCSSLGRLRYAVMLRIGRKNISPLCLIDVKEATAAAAPAAPGAIMPVDNGRRVLAGAKALSPNLGDRMIAGKLMAKSVVMRELMPQDLKIEVGALTPKKATALARYLARVVGRAHGRQMEPKTREKWREQLSSFHPAGLDAPTWLWTNVVELLGMHEMAYLEHCRVHALKAKGRG